MSMVKRAARGVLRSIGYDVFNARGILHKARPAH